MIFNMAFDDPLAHDKISINLEILDRVSVPLALAVVMPRFYAALKNRVLYRRAHSKENRQARKP